MPRETEETCLDEYVAAREQFEKLMGEPRLDVVPHLRTDPLLALASRSLIKLMSLEAAAVALTPYAALFHYPDA